MATLNASKSGRLAYLGGGSHSTARNASTATNTSVNPTFTTGNGIQYTRAAGRRGNSFSIYRAFYYFDTSGITGTVSVASLNIAGYQNTTADVIVVPSTAFGGDGSADIVAGDFNNLSFNGNYSAEFTGWGTSNNSLSLKPQARTDIQNNNYFICAVIQYDNDYLDTDPGSTTTLAAGVKFGTAAFLDYTEEAAASGPANLTSLNGITKSNITNVNTITLANITSINTIA